MLSAETKKHIQETMELYYQRDRSTSDALIKDLQYKTDKLDEHLLTVEKLLKKVVQLVNDKL